MSVLTSFLVIWMLTSLPFTMGSGAGKTSILMALLGMFIYISILGY